MRLFPLRLKEAIVYFLFLCVFTASYGQVSYEEAFPNISFNVPVEIQNASDGSNRLFVVEQQGTIKVFPNNNEVTPNQVSTFLDISSKVAYSSGQEIGLLGLAFHPEFESNGYIFVFYIDSPSNYRINIVRYQVSSANPNLIDPNSETIIAQFTKNQSESNHNGGKIAFGPDGYLYISIGDGGGGGDPQGNAQNLNTVFGSMLRIDIDVNGNNPIEQNPELPNGNYEIPADNPRLNQTGLDEIYAWGLRNTWKFSFDPTGRLWGADVGQNMYEEINFITNGGNFGWNRFEANSDYNSNTVLASTLDIKPVYGYDHNQGDKSITGGYMYNGSLTSSALAGNYIYGDFTTGRVWALSYNLSNGSTTSTLLFRASGQSISSFGEDETGELYFSGYGNNAKLFRLTDTVTGPVTNPTNGIGEWKGISSGTNGTVETIVRGIDNMTYVGGNFTNAGGVTVSNLAVITPEGQWQNLGGGTNGNINSIAIAPNGYIFVGGEFTQIGDIAANNIAFWNGSVWTSLGTGTNGPILDLKFDQEGSLFAGGVFTSSADIAVNNIAKWQDGNWMSLSDSTTDIAGTNNEIRSIAFDQANNLYVGGNFDTAGGIPAARIAKWDNLNWSALGEGTSGFVQAISIVDDYLYAGGNFNLAGTITANRIARWNFTNSIWETLGDGLSGSVNAITSNENYVFVGGDFETASDTENSSKTVNNIARWSYESGWEALGQDAQVGVNSSVLTLAFSKSLEELYVGGTFDVAGSVQNKNIAIWGEGFCTQNSITPEYQENGVWDSGKNTLTLTEGDALVLSMLPNTADFTITLPNGEVVMGDYTIDSVTSATMGTYTFTTAIGCVEFLELIVNDSLDMDTDGDGVFDPDDICPNTLGGAVVDANGCEQNGFPVGQFSIASTANSCATSPNGKIQIGTSLSGSYVATLLRDSQTISTNEFTTILNIEDLENGSYDICITATTANLQACYSLAVDNAVVGFEVLSSLNETDTETSLILSLSGASKYYINLNGTLIETELNEIILGLNKDVNRLMVNSNNSCQGTYKENIVLNDAFIVYPNPVKDFVTVDMSYLSDNQIEISLYAASGKLLHSELYATSNDTVTIDTAHLAPGYFFLRIKGNNIDKGFKLIKG